MNSANSQTKKPKKRLQRQANRKLFLTPEKRLINRIRQLFNSSRIHFNRWIGEDVAELTTLPGLRFSSENFVENVHFKINLFPPESVGYRCLAGALSDLAASGSRPLFFLFNLSVPARFNSDYLLGVLRGLKKCSNAYSVPLAGGDVTSSPAHLMLSVTVAGQKIHNSFLRSVAHPGDLIYLSGPTGLASGELKLLLLTGKMPDKNSKRLFQELFSPRVELETAFTIAKQNPERVACTDTSDSLLEAAENISEASNVKIVLDIKSHHITRKLRELSEKTHTDPIELFLFGGEDYRLLFALPEHFKPRGAKLIHAGRVERGKGVMVFYNGVELKVSDKSPVFTHKFNF